MIKLGTRGINIAENLGPLLLEKVCPSTRGFVSGSKKMTECVSHALLVEWCFEKIVSDFIRLTRLIVSTSPGFDSSIKELVMGILTWGNRYGFLTVLTIMSFSVSIHADNTIEKTSAGKGLEIAKEADRRSSGYGNFQANMKMVLVDKSGNESLRFLRVKNLEVDRGNVEDKSLMVFDRPRDVRGTALLTYTYTDQDDDQWLYLPALRRVKTIVSSNRSGPFMGSEFSFEDMSTQVVEKYSYKYLRNEGCGGLDCFVVERKPKDKNSGYSREVISIDTNEYRTRKVDYYDRRGRFLKTLILSGYDIYSDEFWRPSMMSMINHETGKGTVLHWSNFEFGVGIDASDFNKNSLKRVR